MQYGTILRTLRIFIVTGFYLGYLPIAPATFGCLISVVIWYFLIAYRVAYILVGITLFLLGVIISNNFTKIWGKDPRQIVIDEYASLLLPLYFTPRTIAPLVITLALFRIFDLTKPPPIKKLEQLPAGWGVMLDDLGAAIYTTAIILATRILNINP